MYKRWYDQDPACTKFMSQIRSIRQRDVQEFCGRMLMHFAERMRKQIQYKNYSGLTSIGVPGLAQLYKFKSKRRRWYDEVHPVQKAVGILYTLPPEGLIALGFTIGDTFGLIGIYTQVCVETGQPPLIQDLVNISKKTLYEGPKEAMELVRELVGEELFDLIHADMMNENSERSVDIPPRDLSTLEEELTRLDRPES